MNQGYKDLKAFQLAYKLSMEIFFETKIFPKEEVYSLTDQIRRSSRSICTNIREGYRKRIYPKHFVAKITDADSECTETMIWLDFAKDCHYLKIEKYNDLFKQYEEVEKILNWMINHPEKFIPKEIVRQIP
jgi:four helix bundle protein